MSPSLRLVAQAGVLLFCLSALPVSAKEPPSPDGKWTVVYVGGSWLPDATRMFSEYLTQDLGVGAIFTERRNYALLAPATQSLDSGSRNWDVLSDAQVIVVHIEEATDTPGYCTDTAAETPYRTTPGAYRRDIDAFLTALTKHASPKETAIRVATHAALPHFRGLWRERGVEEQCLAGLMELNAQWKDAAASFGVQVVDVFAAWNGADGARDAPRKYFGMDGGHLSEAGSRLSRNSLSETGLERALRPRIVQSALPWLDQ